MKCANDIKKGNSSFTQNYDKAELQKLSAGQSPKILWIGCSDSRVSPEVITGAKLGEIFVHRNIANQVLLEDGSVLSVLEYALRFLKVETVVVCGHTNCGGAKAAIDGVSANDHISPWITSLENVAAKVKSANPNASASELEQKVLESNVLTQLNSIQEIISGRRNWEIHNDLKLIGCLFDIGSGEVRVLEERGEVL